jgi:uncharacterized protein YkwD
MRGRLAAILIAYLLPVFVQAQTVEPHEFDAIERSKQASRDSSPTTDLKQTAEQIFVRTNRFRTQQGRRELKVNERLARAAQDFADFLAHTDTISHTADGKSPSQRVAENGYRYCLVAENIAWEYNLAGFPSSGLARAFVTGWRHSPEHRRNMLDPDLEEIGVGLAHSARTGRYYAVQDFGRPHSSAIVFKITNESDATIHYTVDGKSFTLDPQFTVTHQRCRPPEVDFQLARGKDEKDGEEVFHPRNGAHYFVRGDQDRGHAVESH